VTATISVAMMIAAALIKVTLQLVVPTKLINRNSPTMLQCHHKNQEVQAMAESNQS
jgi:hypothetical protein